ncbi:MAG: YdbH domain-containing protein, partial [Moraxellaceae bacterium]|nr:YdbH domain-containing protein [Moraxellaceae bacterium]
AQVLGGRLVDAAERRRFNPLDVTGTVGLAAETWRGDLALASGGTPVADVELVHDGATGIGSVAVDTGRLAFSDGGLQPLDLSPLAAAIGSPAVGSAQFLGGFQWRPDGTGSQGRLSVFALDFISPAGAVRGLAGDLDFTSLAPLVTAPGQQLAAQELQLLAPLATPQVTFQLLGRSLEVSGGAVNVGGGTVRLEPMSVPFDGSESWRGELVVEGVQLADIVSATPFADRVSLSARVSGRLPFIVGPDGFRLVQGRLEAIEPGRLSIRRAALTDVRASGGDASAALEGLGESAPVTPIGETNTAVEFAYQAMEHLAFDLLDAEVNSLPGGRLGVLFHVRGEH